MSNLYQTTSSQKGLLERFSDLFWRIICLIASYPSPKYLKILGNDCHKGRVVASACCVVLSSSVFAWSVHNNFTLAFGEKFLAFGYVLVVVALILDWLIMSGCWSKADKGTRTLSKFFCALLIRALLICISLVIAVVTGVLSQKNNSQKALSEYEINVALQVPEFKVQYDFYSQQIEGYQASLLGNEKRIKERPVYVQEMAIKNRCARKEESPGQARFDEECGHIKGGGICGVRCEELKNEAAALKMQVEELDSIPASNLVLEEKIRIAAEKQQQLLETKLSDPNSIGSLLAGALKADVSTQLMIFGVLIFVVILEMSAFIIAHFPVHENLLDAVTHQATNDKLELGYANKLNQALIHSKHAINRAKVGDNFPPVTVVRLSSRKNKSETV